MLVDLLILNFLESTRNLYITKGVILSLNEEEFVCNCGVN